MHAHGPLPGSPLDLAAFLALGLVGSAAHCVGMCAPFALLVARRYSPPAGTHGAVASQLWYAAGRLVTYAALGAVGGATGLVLQAAGALVGLQRTAALVAGAALVVSATASLLALAPAGAYGSTWLARVTTRLATRMPGHPLGLGLVLGLLPCGLLYTAVVAAMARGSAAQGALALAAFGLGTVPAMLGVSLVDAVVVRRRVMLNRAAQVFALAMGTWYMWRGLVPMP